MLCPDVESFNMRVVVSGSQEEEEDEQQQQQQPWMEKLQRWQTGVLLLSRSAVAPRISAAEDVVRDVRSTLAALRRLYPHMLVIWRNEVAPHERCWEHRKPLKERAPAPTSVAALNAALPALLQVCHLTSPTATPLTLRPPLS
eukprot:jgi/Mesen1/5298/ME000264S04325